MKILYSQLKQLVPGLKATPKQIGEKFTMAGFMMDGLEEITFQGKQDYLISLEVRQNRADCLSIMGLAGEVASYYGLTCRLPLYKPAVPLKGDSDIRIEALKQVKRALAFEISGVKNKKSPTRLKEFLALYGINSINLLVDLSNYVMLLTGYPSHLLDKDKMKGKLCWAVNQNFKEITTLDGTKIKLAGKEIILKDDKNILGLAGIVGGKTAEIGINSRNIIAEMAIYERVSIRKDSRSLKIVTEASIRLEKDLSPEKLDLAMDFLIFSILKEAGGKINVKPFSFYPNKQPSLKIKLDPRLISVFAGVEISQSKAISILKDLRFKVSKSGQSLEIVPPLDRMDINVYEDVIEEVIRIFGFEKIPSDQAPAFAVTNQMTSMTIKFSEKARDILAAIGFDEILSWPLTKKEINSETNYSDWDNISTQNSVNEEFPDLRQSIAPSLLFQLKEYKKRNIGKIKLFEIGRVFGKKGSNYLEQESLGILIEPGTAKKVTLELKKAVEILLLSLGFNEISYLSSITKPKIANPFSCWDIQVKGETVGIIYKISKSLGFAEINISKISNLAKGFNPNPAIELINKLVVLDANVELKNANDIKPFLKSLEKEIGKNLWSLELIDIFSLKDRTRYTIKASYVGLSDKEAKEMHSKVFNL